MPREPLDALEDLTKDRPSQVAFGETHQLELRRLLDGQVGWLGPYQDLVHVLRGSANQVR